MNFDDTLVRIARERNASPDQILADMEEAIAAARNNPNFKAVFGDKTPSAEEFVQTLALMLEMPVGTDQ